jgi:putative two-component system response regulator
MAPRKKLLLVDDDEAVIEYLNVKLGGEFELVATGLPDKVLPLAIDERPDLVLCDIDLPGMDGGDISAALFGDPRTHDIPLVFLTALASAEDLHAKGNQLAGRSAISKQSPIEEIVARIRASLE